MPQYKVIDKGYFNDRLYDPEGKRKTLHTDKPFKTVPSWLKAIKPETAAERKKRLALEAKQAKADIEKAEQDATEIDVASTIGSGETSSNIETI